MPGAALAIRADRASSAALDADDDASIAARDHARMRPLMLVTSCTSIGRSASEQLADRRAARQGQRPSLLVGHLTIKVDAETPIHGGAQIRWCANATLYR